MRLLAVLFGILLFFSSTRASEDDVKFTRSFHNGRWWKGNSSAENLGFIVGYLDGVKVALVTEHRGETGAAETIDAGSRRLWPFALTYGEVSEALDRFYGTPENGPISIGQALAIISERSQGVAESKIDSDIQWMRKQASEPLAQPK